MCKCLCVLWLFFSYTVFIEVNYWVGDQNNCDIICYDHCELWYFTLKELLLVLSLLQIIDMYMQMK